MAPGSRERAKALRDRREAVETPPLVEAKLQAPAAGGDQVKRPRIRQALDAGGAGSLIACRCAGGLRQDDRGPRLVREQGGRRRVGHARRGRQRSGSALDVCRDRRRSDPAGTRAWCVAIPERGGEFRRTGRRRADERNRRVRHRTGSRARRPPDGDGPRVSCLDRLCARASAGECAPDRHHTSGSRARAGAAACPGSLAEMRADELAFTAAEAHELLVERGHVELGTEEIELLVAEHRGLAGGARPRRALATGCR